MPIIYLQQQLIDAPVLVRLDQGTVRYRYTEEERNAENNKRNGRVEKPHEGHGIGRKTGYFYHATLNDFSEGNYISLSYQTIHISMALCKTAETPLLMHWCYCSLALSHQYRSTCILKFSKSYSKQTLHDFSFQMLLTAKRTSGSSCM